MIDEQVPQEPFFKRVVDKINSIVLKFTDWRTKRMYVKSRSLASKALTIRAKNGLPGFDRIDRGDRYARNDDKDRY